MAFMVSAITFVMMVVIFLTVWIVTSAKSTQELVRGRIEELQAAERWGGIATNLKLVRDEMYSTVPVLHRMMAQSPIALWVQKFISQAGMKTKPAKFLLVSVVTGVVTYSLWDFVPFFISVPVGILVSLIPLANMAWKRRKRFDGLRSVSRTHWTCLLVLCALAMLHVSHGDGCQGIARTHCGRIFDRL